MHSYLNEHQKAAIEALEELQVICDKHNIKFYLLAGSALGAVRHQGMVPWDDDIDVGLCFDDWYRLRKILPNELSRRFQYVDNDIEKNFPRLFGKILYNRQNCIDLFLLVKWSDNLIEGKIRWRFHRTIVEFYKFSIGYNACPRRPDWTKWKLIKYCIFQFIYKTIYFFVKQFLKREDYVRLARWNEKYFENSKTDYYINLYSIYPMRKEMIKAKWIEHPSNVIFEGNSYRSIGEIEEYLTHLYGDYMVLPPEANRINTHQEIF